MSKTRKLIIAFLVLVILGSIVALLILNLDDEEVGREYDEQEVLAAVGPLLRDAELLNFVYYGSGIRYYDTNETSNGYYRKADTAHLEELGFSTIDELKALTEKTFSNSYSDLIYSTVISYMSDGSAVISPARYYQATDEETGEYTHIIVYSKYSYLFKDSITYDYNSFKVTGSKGEKVYVTVDATVTRADGATQQTTITVTLYEEADGWRIDGPTYANYNENKDRYDELKNQDID